MTSDCDEPQSKKLKITHENNEKTAWKGYRESDFGISEFMNNLEPFIGVIKQRYSDFVVNEIDKNGKLIEVSSTELPEGELKEFPKPACVDDTMEEKLVEMNQSPKSVDELLIESSDDKQERYDCHQYIKQKFPLLDSTTADRDEKKVIIVKRKRQKDGRGQRRSGFSWPPQRPDYLHFVLYKENLGTSEALQLVAQRLGIKGAALQFAGTKDKRAITSQRVSVLRVHAFQLQKANFSLRNIILGNFEYSPNQIKLGNLKGNRFRLAIKQVTASEDHVGDCVKSLVKSGFLNYFGMQRFGTTAVPTHWIGRAILRSDWKEAVNLILMPRDGEREDERAFREVWSTTGDATLALKSVRNYNSVEAQLLRALERVDSTNYCGALAQVPRNTRVMYVHAYQSFLWNKVLSRRVQKFGLSPIVGDLVPEDTLEDLECDEAGMKLEKNVVLKVLKEEDLSSYSLNDCVLPLVGFDVQYPDNEVGEWYEDLLKEDGLSMDCLQHRVKDYALPGTYRKMCVVPGDLQWHFQTYSSSTDILVASSGEFPGDVEANDAKSRANEEFHLQKALLLQFSLPSSCYATMFLRDLLKIDTSVSFQCTLNNCNSQRSVAENV